VVVTVEIDVSQTALLHRLGYLSEPDLECRSAIADALRRLLASIVA
jgi:hypothetical protein